jgi:hypothetical protein
MKITKHQIIMIAVLLIIGYGYSQYNNKLAKGIEKEERDLIQEYLASDVKKMDRRKPFLWIHIEYDINERNWLNFGSRNTKNLNQPYLYLCIRSIVEKCGNSFNVCIVDDNVFNKLIPGWSINVGNLATPLRPHIRELAMARLLNKYGGMRVPPSFICFHDLITLYQLGTSIGTGAEPVFVAEMLSNSIASSVITFSPCPKMMGCHKDTEFMGKYIEYLEEIVSQDYTNEMEFEGKISKWFYDAVSLKMVNLIKPDLIGVKDAEGKPILLDHLMSDSADIEFASENFGLYIPACQLLKRRNFGWFVRMSPKQVLESNTQIAKYMLAMQ